MLRHQYARSVSSSSSSKRGRRGYKQAKTHTTCLPKDTAPIIRDQNPGDQASRQKKEPKKTAARIAFCDVNPNTCPGASITNQSTEVPLFKKEGALTPPWIPNKGLHQIWPVIGFKDVSKEGARVLKIGAVQIDGSDDSTCKTSRMTPHRP